MLLLGSNRPSEAYGQLTLRHSSPYFEFRGIEIECEMREAYITRIRCHARTWFVWSILRSINIAFIAKAVAKSTHAASQATSIVSHDRNCGRSVWFLNKSHQRNMHKKKPVACEGNIEANWTHNVLYDQRWRYTLLPYYTRWSLFSNTS